MSKYRVENIASEGRKWKLWEVQVERDGEWFDLFEDPPKEVCDRVVAFLNREEERSLMSNYEELDRRLTEFKDEYDRHLVFGKWGSMAAIALSLLIFVVQAILICWLIWN